jgi:hypothetical protein
MSVPIAGKEWSSEGRVVSIAGSDRSCAADEPIVGNSSKECKSASSNPCDVSRAGRDESIAGSDDSIDGNVTSDACACACAGWLPPKVDLYSQSGVGPWMGVVLQVVHRTMLALDLVRHIDSVPPKAARSALVVGLSPLAHSVRSRCWPIHQEGHLSPSAPPPC